jgi:hypothetical protein
MEANVVLLTVLGLFEKCEMVLILFPKIMIFYLSSLLM